MIYTKLTRKALRLAYSAHDGQEDCSGIAYIFHPLAVAEKMDDEYSACAAILHDIVEDTDITIEYLAKKGFPQEVVLAVDLLTKRPGQDYEEYILQLKDDPIAKKVKIADLRHNLDPTRLKKVTKKDLSRYQRYQRALQELDADE